MKKVINNDILENRKKLILAFQVIRRNGFLAYANFACCNTCATAAIFDNYERLPEDKKNTKEGYVFWHRQNEENLLEDGILHLGFGIFETIDDHDNRVEEEIKVGEKLVNLLSECGINVSWNGDPNIKILVNLKDDI